MKELARIMKDIESDESRDWRLARELRKRFELSDSFIHSIKWNDNRMIIRIELMSSLLRTHPRFSNSKEGLTPTDLLAIIPLIAIVAEDRIEELQMCVLDQDEQSFLVLGFSAASVERLAIALWRTFSRWQGLATVLMRTIQSNHPIEIDWKEFLAGESGFVTVSREYQLSQPERERAMNNIRMSSYSLLRSVLDSTAWKDRRVQNLLSFLDNLQIQSEVPSIDFLTPEMQMFGGAVE